LGVTGDIESWALSRVAGILLLPSWPWLIVSAVMVFGVNARRSRSRPALRIPAWPRVWLVAGAVVAVAVIVGGFAVGAAKGAVRVLPGPRYQVSALDINQAAWTTISAAQYHVWEARFVREDAFFMLFGLVLATGCVFLLSLHREAIDSSPEYPFGPLVT